MSVVTAAEINEFLERDFSGNGNRCESVDERSAVAILRPDDSHLRPGGIISGPTVFGLCDAALYYACFTVLGIEPMVLTSELSIRYLRPAFGSELRARADLHQVGRRLVIGSVTAWTTDPAKPVAVAQGTYTRP
ncbi:MAG: PaaI family thioesterase [Ilumatobacteraceae bacterium]